MAGRVLTLKAPAKLNLYLKVLRRRPDGYHDLCTLFHRISLADTLRLQKCKLGFTLHCSHPALSTGPENLITKAYRALKAEFPKLGGVSVRLTKRIPIGGGLGGGSSNAAALLLGMKWLYRLPISEARLMALGRKLGADVPFFICNLNQCIGLGIGDKLQSLPAKRPHWFVLVISGHGLSTSKVYQNLPKSHKALSLTKAKRAVRLLSNLLKGKELEKISLALENDLEKPAFRLRPSLKKMIQDLGRCGIKAVLSGSGPTLFAICAGKHEARRRAGQIRRAYPSKTAIVCHTV